MTKLKFIVAICIMIPALALSVVLVAAGSVLKAAGHWLRLNPNTAKAELNDWLGSSADIRDAL